ncbi:MAG TPA: DoxX family protein [Rariglobus sp.]|nr:DoxX family protein [Rariglobus sp.]
MQASRKQTAARWVLALFFIIAGVNHFLAPEIYLGMMPAWLPFKESANVISGAAEIAGGIGLLIPRFRRAAAWGLIALLIAVFPANIQVAIQGHMPGLENAPPALLWARLLFQPVFVAWVWWVGLRRNPTRS